MKKSSLFFTLVLNVTFLLGQNGIVFPDYEYTSLQYIDVDGNTIVGASRCNLIYLSKDEGRSYETISSPGIITKVRFVPNTNGSKCYLLDLRNIYMLDTDTKEITPLGATPELEGSGILRRLHVDDKYVYIISVNKIYRSPHTRIKWEKMISFPFNSEAISASDITADNLYIGTTKGKFYKMAKSNQDTTLINIFSKRINHIDMINDLLGYYTLQSSNYPLKTEDGGATTTPITSLESINVIGYQSDIVLSINTNRIYLSKDGGQTGKRIPTNINAFTDLVTSYKLMDDGTLYLAGRASLILKTTDFGESFTNLNPVLRANLYDISINQAGVGYAVGQKGALLKTMDDGASWTRFSIFQNASDLHNVEVLNDGTVMMSNSKTLYTINSSGTITDSTEISLIALYSDQQTGMLMGVIRSSSKYKVILSNDKGKTWSTKLEMDKFGYQIYRSATGKYYITTGTNKVYTSTDDGQTWTGENFGIDKIVRVDFLNDNFGIFSTNSALYKTLDGGQNSEKIAVGYVLNNLHVFDEQNFFYTSAQDSKTNVRVTENGGDRFNTGMTVCAGSTNSFRKGNSIWFSHMSGYLSRYSFESVGTKQVIRDYKISFYPNPVRPYQLLHIDGVDKGILQVSFINQLGQLVASYIFSGASITLGDIPPGIYTIKIQSRRMISYEQVIVAR